ncbi:MAG: hypothetical protein JSS35_14400 [Proteobacteria bacterium]|nr:hypothetical protein [Pseudomonadota bacterium]
MSRADDESLQAMKATGMSEQSIAYVMAWPLSRVKRRLAQLTAPDAPVAEVAGTNPVRKAAELKPREIAEGRGVVARTFMRWEGDYGAWVQLPTGVEVYTETGDERLEVGQDVGLRVGGSGCHIYVPDPKPQAVAA